MHSSALLIIAALSSASCTAERGPPPPPRVPADVARGVTLTRIADGLDKPVALTFAPGDTERLFVVEQCRDLSLDYARTRIQFGRPIGEFQLIQLKLAKMEVARMNIQNMVFRQIELTAAGKSLTLAEASAMKLYAAQAAMEVALEAVQLFGGNGYMAEFQVEQLARDAKVLQIYAGTDEIQVSQIARSLLAG